MLKTKNQTKRLIYFTGHPEENNSVMITQICNGYETISKFFISGECATRTLLNLYNLHAVRGLIINGQLDLDSSMSGPHHYFGYIDPFKAHSIIIKHGLPEYYVYPLFMVKSKSKSKICDEYILKISNYNWYSGRLYNNLEKIYDYTSDINIDSLFVVKFQCY